MKLEWQKRESGHYVLIKIQDSGFAGSLPLARIYANKVHKKDIYNAQLYTWFADKCHSTGKGGFTDLDEAKAWVMAIVRLT